MNELLFFSHIIVLLGLLLVGVRLGQKALTLLFALQLVLANLFIVKPIVLFGLHVTATDVFTIGSLFCLGCLQEYHGKKAAREAVWLGFFSLIVLGAMAQFHLLYRPTHTAYAAILSHTPRVLISSFVVALIADRIDIALFAKIRARLFLRFGGSALFSQLLDTVLFSFAALYGTAEALGELILFSFAIKALCIFCMAPAVALTKKVTRAV